MKILFVTVSISSFNTGGSIYSYGIMDRLADLTNMDILTYEEPFEYTFSYYHKRLKEKTKNIYFARMKKTDLLLKYIKYQNTFVRYSISMERKADELIEKNHYDIVIIDHLRMGFVASITKKYGSKVVLIEHNIETQNYYEQLKLAGHLKYKLKNWGLPKFEKDNLHLADTVWCITDSDSNYFKSLQGMENKKFEVIMPYFPYQRIKNDYNPRKILVITGTMSWYPNIEGVKWFVENVFNKLLTIDNEYKLYVVGRNPDPQITMLQSPNIIVTGTVPSVDEYLINADLLIVPNKLGGGAKIKIVEGVFKGIPCIVMQHSIAGYENVIPDNDFIVENGQEYIDRIIAINNDYQKKKLFVDNFIEKAKRNSSLKNAIEAI